MYTVRNVRGAPAAFRKAKCSFSLPSINSTWLLEFTIVVVVYLNLTGNAHISNGQIGDVPIK